MNVPNRAGSEDDQELKNGETPGEAEDINGSVNGRRRRSVIGNVGNLPGVEKTAGKESGTRRTKRRPAERAERRAA